MKKSLKIINIILILIFFINLLIVDVKADDPETGAKKGDIRCPIGSGNKCTQNSDGSVSVQEKLNDITIIKTVSKSKDLGVYDVKFEAIGAKKTIKKPAYVVLIIDASGSIHSQISNVAKAVEEFSRILIEENPNVNIAYTVFGTNNIPSNGFGKNIITAEEIKEKNPGTTRSNIRNAFASTNNDLKLCSQNGEKYVVVFGDNKYSGSVMDEYGKLQDACGNKINFFSINFSKGESYMYNGFVCGSRSLLKKDDCGKRDSHYLEVNGKDYEQAFKDMASKVGLVIQESNASVKIIDNIGKDFEGVDIASKDYNVNLDDTSEKGFQIKIDSNASNDWHPTNDGYKVLTIDGVAVNYTSSINPEVYWETEKRFFGSCSDTIEKSYSDSDLPLTYYSKKCEEGWNGVSGLKATLKVNGWSPNTKFFNMKGGMGFPIAIELSTNVRCTYTFNYDKFKEDYQNVIKSISSLSPETPEFYDTIKEKLIPFYTNIKKYIDISKGLEINDLIKRFTDQDGVLKIKYSDDKEPKEMNFINDGDVSVTAPPPEDKKSYNLTSLNLNGIKNQYGLDLEDISDTSIHDYVYTVNLSKKLKLEDTCLNMRGGDQEDCVDSLAEPNQLYGGNKYYVRFLNKQQAASLLGFVTIELDNVGFSNTNIRLEGDKKMDGNNYNCAFDISPFNPPKYRNIEVSNPFVGGTLFNSLTERTIGKNYLNENRSFIKIIDKEIWNEQKNESDFIYKLSKENVAAIRKDTNTLYEKVESYIGKDCYFNANKKYICPFTRGILKNGAPDSIFFITSPKIKNGV